MADQAYTFRYSIRNCGTYNQALIAGECALMLKSVYGLSLRAARGFVSSMMSLMKLDLPIPGYSTLCRRQNTLKGPLFLSAGSRPRHLVMDATGLHVYATGEWHGHKQGALDD
jgi:hypothetical protein